MLASACARKLKRLGTWPGGPHGPVGRRGATVESDGDLPSRPKDRTLATPNYSYEKRQRELAKKRKAEEKAAEKKARKAQGRSDEPSHGDDADPASPEAGQAPSQEA